MKIKTMGAVLAAAALLAGCGGESAPAETPTVTVTATSKVTVSATPDGRTELVPASLDNLLFTLRAQGLQCDGWTATSEILGECDGGTQLSWFPDTDEGRAAHKAAVTLALTAIITQDRPDVSLVVGRNWLVRASTEGATILQDRVGGVVLGTS